MVSNYYIGPLARKKRDRRILILGPSIEPSTNIWAQIYFTVVLVPNYIRFEEGILQNSVRGSRLHKQLVGPNSKTDPSSQIIIWPARGAYVIYWKDMSWLTLRSSQLHDCAKYVSTNILLIELEVVCHTAARPRGPWRSPGTTFCGSPFAGRTTSLARRSPHI